MLFHGIETGHKLVLSYADLSVWCYGCDNYVHNQVGWKVKQCKIKGVNVQCHASKMLMGFHLF